MDKQLLIIRLLWATMLIGAGTLVVGTILLATS